MLLTIVRCFQGTKPDLEVVTKLRTQVFKVTNGTSFSRCPCVSHDSPQASVLGPRSNFEIGGGGGGGHH